MPEQVPIVKRTIIPQLLGANRVAQDDGNARWVFVTPQHESFEFELAPAEQGQLLKTFAGGLEIAREMPDGS